MEGTIKKAQRLDGTTVVALNTVLLQWNHHPEVPTEHVHGALAEYGCVEWFPYYQPEPQKTSGNR